MVALHGGHFDRAVHAFDLAVGPGVAGLGEAVLDAVLGADASKMCRKAHGWWRMLPNWMPLSVSTVCTRYGSLASTRRRNSAAAFGGLRPQFGKGRFAGAVNGHKNAPQAFGQYGRPSSVCTSAKSTCRYPMEYPGISFSVGSAVFVQRQAADAVALKATVQDRAGKRGMVACRA
jgi:hypothetical protein